MSMSKGRVGILTGAVLGAAGLYFGAIGPVLGQGAAQTATPTPTAVSGAPSPTATPSSLQATVVALSAEVARNASGHVALSTQVANYASAQQKVDAAQDKRTDGLEGRMVSAGYALLGTPMAAASPAVTLTPAAQAATGAVALTATPGASASPTYAASAGATVTTAPSYTPTPAKPLAWNGLYAGYGRTRDLVNVKHVNLLEEGVEKILQENVKAVIDGLDGKFNGLYLGVKANENANASVTQLMAYVDDRGDNGVVKGGEANLNLRTGVTVFDFGNDQYEIAVTSRLGERRATRYFPVDKATAYRIAPGLADAPTPKPKN